MGKGNETASVIFIIGSSSAGKNTLIRKILEQNAALPEAQKLNWKKFGHDDLTVNILREADAKFLDELKKKWFAKKESKKSNSNHRNDYREEKNNFIRGSR